MDADCMVSMAGSQKGNLAIALTGVQQMASNRREGTKTKGRQIRKSQLLGPGDRIVVKCKSSLLLNPHPCYHL